MWPDGATRIGTLRLRASAEQAAALRLAVAGQLAAADLRPPGLPPAAVLVVRRLDDPLPGRLRRRPGCRLDPAWERAARRRLAELDRAAVRPADGGVPADAVAVRFRDEAEMLACLALDLSRGRAAERWWWRALLRRRPEIGRGPGTLLAVHARHVPAILAGLAARGRAAAVTASLSEPEAAEVVWKRPLGGGNVLKYKQHMSTPSPVTDGETVWVMTGTGILKAFDFDGKELWGRDVQADYGAFGLKWGYASSPRLWGDALFVPVLHGMETDDPSYLLRVDKATGKTVWRTERPTDAVFESPDSYMTPAILKRDDHTEVILTGGDVVTGHDAETGEELWRAGGLNPDASKSHRLVASPIVGDGLIYAFGKRGPILALRAGGRGDVTTSHLAWSRRQGTDVPTPIVDGKYLYVVDDKGLMSCYEAATGTVVYGPERLKTGTYSASPVLADGKVYATSETGVTSVVRAGPRLEILAENDLGGYTLASPAISDGQIFLRTADFLFAIGERVAR